MSTTSTADRPGPLTLARAVAVVAGGPLLLAAAALVAPVAAVRRWPDRARSAAATHLL